MTPIGPYPQIVIPGNGNAKVRGPEDDPVFKGSLIKGEAEIQLRTLDNRFDAADFKAFAENLQLVAAQLPLEGLHVSTRMMQAAEAMSEADFATAMDRDAFLEPLKAAMEDTEGELNSYLTQLHDALRVDERYPA
jgi:hypothetical protein